MADFIATNHTETVELPPNAMCIVFDPNVDEEGVKDKSMFNIRMLNNFQNTTKNLTDKDKALFLICQGIMDIAQKRSGYLLDCGHKVMETVVNRLMDPKKLENMEPKGRA